MDIIENFSQIIDRLSKRLHTQIEFDKNGHSVFTLDGKVVVSMEYLPDSRAILLWSSPGVLPETDEHVLARAKYLLRVQDLGLETHGFTIGLDPEDRRTVIHDIRSLAELTTEDKLSAWLDNLVTSVETISREIAEKYPYNDDNEAEPTKEQ